MNDLYREIEQQAQQWYRQGYNSSSGLEVSFSPAAFADAFGSERYPGVTLHQVETSYFTLPCRVNPNQTNPVLVVVRQD